jgi:hypothetical protein
VKINFDIYFRHEIGRYHGRSDITVDQPSADPMRAQPKPRAEGPSEGSAKGVSPLARKIWGLENAVDAISDAEKPISQRISERAI